MSIRDKIAPRLIEGETILWSGQPHFPLVSRFLAAVLKVLGSGCLIAAIVLFVVNLSCDLSIPMLVIFGLSLLLLPDIITSKRKETYLPFPQS